MKKCSLWVGLMLCLAYPTLAAAINTKTDQQVEQRMDELFGGHQPYKRFFFQLKNAVLKNQRQQVSDLIGYPINIYGETRKYVIQNKAELLTLYDAVFSRHLLAVFQQQQFKNLFAKGSGVMMGQGEVWFHGICADLDCNNVKIEVKSLYNPSFFTSAQGKKAFNDLMMKEKSGLHPSLVTFDTPVLLWHTKNHIIRVDRTGKERYRYAAWDIRSHQSKTPSLILEKGQLVLDGNGGNHHYRFENGDYTYLCYVYRIGAQDTPTGAVQVLKKGRKILDEAVVKDLSL